jgi:hypothetical protein
MYGAVANLPWWQRTPAVGVYDTDFDVGWQLNTHQQTVLTRLPLSAVKGRAATYRSDSRVPVAGT